MSTTNENYNTIMNNVDTELPTLLPNADNAQTLLNDITTTSKVAEHRLWAFITAFSHTTLQNQIAEHEIEVNKLQEEKDVCDKSWYRNKAFEWQFGYDLFFQTSQNKFLYNVVDAAAQFVKFCAIDDESGPVKIKLAGADSSGNPIALSSIHLNAITHYFRRIRPAGVKTNCYSFNADLLKFEYVIRYNPLIGLAITQAACEAAVDSYLRTNNLEFEGVIDINTLTDYLQKANGVVKPFYVDSFIRTGTNPFTSFVNEVTTLAGYAIIDPATPISSTFTYVADV